MRLLVLCCAACSGTPSDGANDTDVGGTTPEGCFAQDMALSPGTGETEYVPLTDGDDVTIIHGPQGGWHIWTAGLAEHTGQVVSVHATVTVTSVSEVISGGEADDLPEFKALAAYDDALCSGKFWGQRAFVDDVVTPPAGMSYQQFICSLEGDDLEMSITVDDLDNERTVTSSVAVVAQLDPADVPICHP